MNKGCEVVSFAKEATYGLVVWMWLDVVLVLATTITYAALHAAGFATSAYPLVFVALLMVGGPVMVVIGHMFGSLWECGATPRKFFKLVLRQLAA